MASEVVRTVYVNVPQVIKGSQKAAVLAVANAGAGQAVKLAPVDKGGLKSSIEAESISSKKAKYGSNIIYAAIQEFGGTIKPVRAKMLRFEKDGKVIYAKSVTLKPQPYLRPSADWLKKNGAKAYGVVIRRALRNG